MLTSGLENAESTQRSSRSASQQPRGGEERDCPALAEWQVRPFVRRYSDWIFPDGFLFRAIFSGLFSRKAPHLWGDVSEQYNFVPLRRKGELVRQLWIFRHVLVGAAAEAAIFARVSIFDEEQFLPRHQSSNAAMPGNVSSFRKVHAASHSLLMKRFHYWEM